MQPRELISLGRIQNEGHVVKSYLITERKVNIMPEKESECRLIRPQPASAGRQGLEYQQGISRQTAGASGIHMQLANIPPNSQGRAHKHEHHETAIYALRGTTRIRYGEQLEYDMEVPEGCFLYIPASLPHIPYNATNLPATVVIARTDACDPESVVMLPDLDCDVLSGLAEIKDFPVSTEEERCNFSSKI